MEFLRFGSSIPGGYWGCCAVDIIQNFKVDPEAKASIEMVTGDGSGPCMNNKGEVLFAGPTYKDIFEQRLRVGTFGTGEMPNHAFIAVLTDWQVSSVIGKAWLKILHANGFEFIRSVSNSVYTGANLAAYSEGGSKKNYIFALIRNIGANGDGNSLTPPKEWTKLGKVVPQLWELVTEEQRKEFAKEQHAAQTELWNAGSKPTFMTEAQLREAGAPVTMAGRRSQFPPQSKETRDSLTKATAAPSPWKGSPVAPAPAVQSAAPTTLAAQEPAKGAGLPA